MSDFTSDDRLATPGEPALLAEDALGVDWNRPEEDAAWARLQTKQ
jgi:hypothetical protein